MILPIVRNSNCNVVWPRRSKFVFVTCERMRNNLGSYKMRGLIELIQLYRAKTNNALANNAVFANSRRRIGDNNGSLVNVQSPGGRSVRAEGASTGGDGKPTPPSPKPRPPPARRVSWIKMVLGSMFSLLLAFWAPKWTTLLRIGGEAEVVLREVEQVAEVVEKVATVTERLSEEVANELPDGNKFKEAALVVEHVSEEAATDAHLAEEIIHKVDVMKQDFEDVEEKLEPFIEKIVHDKKSNNKL
uniref:Uncharacterized protein n=2 Tax=Chenopodium quinoa TaxID=63459 RepID=A0A803LEW6_CHEQI